jgi:RNA polymerase sigma-70 factor (ECF subfamily)
MTNEARRDRVDHSFDAFFRSEYARLAALAAALCGDREEGRDLAQEALSRVYERWGDVATLERPGAWAQRVVVNLARDLARHRGVRRRRLPLLAHEALRRAQTESSPFDGEFWAAVSALPERQRTAVALFYVGDLSIAEVADAMGVVEGSAKTTLHQARRRLRELLNEEMVQ